MRREKAYRGISMRLALRYLEHLGGERVAENEVAGDGWRATLAADSVSVGPTLDITEITVVFEGDRETLDALVERFGRKAMRAGG